MYEKVLGYVPIDVVDMAREIECVREFLSLVLELGDEDVEMEE